MFALVFGMERRLRASSVLRLKGVETRKKRVGRLLLLLVLLAAQRKVLQVGDVPLEPVATFALYHAEWIVVSRD